MRHCVSVKILPKGLFKQWDVSLLLLILCMYIYIHICIYYFPFCIRGTDKQTAVYSFSERMDQDHVRPLLHFENYASCNENGWSLNLMFSGTKDCHIPSLSDTLFSLPHRGNLGMHKCFCKIYSIGFRFSDKKVSIWREIKRTWRELIIGPVTQG